ncbi:hypothetical protein [Streptococcus sp. NLN64]|uniref:DUF6978 family protein n=2 Tax=unclassified Streptococcus TaxID=2608887 RepID=UPI0018CA8B99|nr:hypothetical protein [Streptococcus sp. NLN64]MBF8969954.1 hypothetical protein [Streptococcus sp. NLN76]MBG9367130.1 hypothetical protein [Streptococcus sp. NLN64]
MDLTNLTDKDIATIIKRLKMPKNEDRMTDLYYKLSSLFGKINSDIVIIDTEKLQYYLHVFRGKRNPERYSIHLRLKNLQEHIIRLDINPSNRHTNPDGTVIIGSHIHVYSNQYTKKDATAVLLSESDFPNITHIIDAFDSFLSYTNIRKGN